jgi:hypothetical protein
MINPNRVHRAKGIIKTKRSCGGYITVNGHDVETFQDLSKFAIGQLVNIQASFSIMLDQYIIKTVRKVAT